MELETDNGMASTPICNSRNAERVMMDLNNMVVGFGDVVMGRCDTLNRIEEEGMGRRGDGEMERGQKDGGEGRGEN